MKKLWKLHPKVCGVLLFSAICSPLVTSAENELYVNLFSSSSIQSTLLDNVDKITFGDEAVNVILTDASTISVLYDELNKVTFGENEGSAIETVKTALELSPTIYYQPSNQSVIVASSSPIKTIELYNLQGRIMHQIAPGEEIATLSIEDYPAGVYVVRVDNGKTIKSQKIIKQ